MGSRDSGAELDSAEAGVEDGATMRHSSSMVGGVRGLGSVALAASRPRDTLAASSPRCRELIMAML